MKDIFEFNHIDNSLPESDIKTLKDFYKHYHKKYWCFKKSYRRFKFLDETLTVWRRISCYWHDSRRDNIKSNNPRCYQWRWGDCE